jgi:uracil-DNA glycosylase
MRMERTQRPRRRPAGDQQAGRPATRRADASPRLFGDDALAKPSTAPVAAAPSGARGEDPANDGAETWSELRETAAGCQHCELWQRATQTVFGEGPVPARAMFVGEQPGDKEDRAGRPFVGPAGRILDDALAELGWDRGELYVTNAVKHFKWTPSGSVRIHKSPNAREIKACAPWFEAELAHVRPELLVCLGAVAAKALLGSQFRLTASRGTFIDSPLAPHVLATVHPSSILRARDDRDAAQAAFVDDLRTAFAVLS